MRFPIRFRGVGRLLPILGLTRSSSYVEVVAGRVVVRMGWAFRASAPRSAVAAAARSTRFVLDRGVHGWFGRWLVNGSGDGLVRIDLDPASRAWAGPFPVRLRTLWVSLDDPDGFLAALAPAEG